MDYSGYLYKSLYDGCRLIDQTENLAFPLYVACSVSRRSVGAFRRPYILQLRDYGFEPRTHRQQVFRQKYIHRIY